MLQIIVSSNGLKKLKLWNKSYPFQISTQQSNSRAPPPKVISISGLSYSKKRARDKSRAQFVLRARFCTNILRVLAILIVHIL